MEVIRLRLLVSVELEVAQVASSILIRTVLMIALSFFALPFRPASAEIVQKNTTQPIPSPAPAGMVWVPGSRFQMGGVGPEARADEFPLHDVQVDGFWMDETEVTNAQFKKFVDATNYVTEAEKTTPEIPAGALVFHPTDGPVPLDDFRKWWTWVPGASWKHPFGPKSTIDKLMNHPVVHVSWNDAVAYAKWAGKRLPTEAEFEFAAAGGKTNVPYAWGTEPLHEGKPKANLWQGDFPYAPKVTDGYLLGAPVKSFPPNGYGLYDIIGNVWEWVSDWYQRDYYATLAQTQQVAVNPQGPDSSDQSPPKKVNRGGSFLCNPQFCASYRPAARMRTTPDTGQIHVGFRCVISGPKDSRPTLHPLGP